MFIVYRHLPFLSEMRALLDYTCSKTTLDLKDWFKLEDIVASLYLVAARNAERRKKPFGAPQPSHMRVLALGLFGALVAVVCNPDATLTAPYPRNSSFLTSILPSP